MAPRFFTKSRFALAHECPTKLFYTGKKEYANQDQSDSFLKSLAEGGFQVGELAKLYIPDGIEIDTLDSAEAERRTVELLSRNEVVIYEAAIRFENFLVRCDIFVKQGDQVQLIEVKSKSFDSTKNKIIGENGGVLASWDSYIHDVAFQTFVLKKAYPKLRVSSLLCLVDKTSICPVDGLNQKFLLQAGPNGKTRARLNGTIDPKVLESPQLVLKDVSSIVEKIISAPSFEPKVRLWAQMYERDEKISPQLSSACKDCQFKATKENKAEGLKCGLSECWSQVTGLTEHELGSPTILDLWDCKSKDKLLENKKYFLKDLDESDIGPTLDEKKSGLSRTQRQWLQVQKVKTNDQTPFFDFKSLAEEFSQWKFPLHFIDFETTATAIPFHQGKHPYQGIAFQFSHHTVDKEGRNRHAGQYLHNVPGEFPSFQFLRALKAELDKDDGTIFRYSYHENTYLNFILNQLDDSKEPDHDDLSKFVKSISKPTKNSKDFWEPDREMVDLWTLVKRFFFHPFMGGSNSIKAVLPAVLRESKFLQEKYSKPIYGIGAKVPSLNFKNHCWVTRDINGEIVDPYKSLPKILDETDSGFSSFVFKAESVRDGGSAMMAWARMQFTEMSQRERESLTTALLKYCELDTLAMVMIYEYWREELKTHEANQQIKSKNRNIE